MEIMNGKFFSAYNQNNLWSFKQSFAFTDAFSSFPYPLLPAPAINIHANKKKEKKKKRCFRFQTRPKFISSHVHMRFVDQELGFQVPVDPIIRSTAYFITLVPGAF